MKEPEPRLTVSRAKAKELIQEQIDGGTLIASSPPTVIDLFNDWRDRSSRWQSYTEHLLKRLFDNDGPAGTFSCAQILIRGALSSEVPLTKRVAHVQSSMESQMNVLESLIDRLELFDELTVAADLKGVKQMSRKVFVVHGHDEAFRLQVENILHRLKLEPIVLFEQAGGSKTIIEKIEEYSDVWFAIVLMSDDDIGTSRAAWIKHKESAVRGRARQNVVLELGYFMALVGRGNVCVIQKTVGPQEFEPPSDIAGVGYIKFESKEQMEQLLLREIAKAGKKDGVNIDTNAYYGV